MYFFPFFFLLFFLFYCQPCITHVENTDRCMYFSLELTGLKNKTLKLARIFLHWLNVHYTTLQLKLNSFQYFCYFHIDVLILLHTWSVFISFYYYAFDILSAAYDYIKAKGEVILVAINCDKLSIPTRYTQDASNNCNGNWICWCNVSWQCLISFFSLFPSVFM